MDVETWRVPAEQDGDRLDKVLASRERVGSRGRARKVLASGKVRVNGTPASEGDQGRAVPAGAEVSIAWSQPGSGFARHAARGALQHAGLDVLYEDRWLIAVDKPRGLLTDSATRVQAREEDSVRKRVHAWLKTRGDRAFVVHRIDRDTTGVVLLAKTEAASESLRGQFRQRTPERVYRTIVLGEVDGDEGLWSHWMAWNPRALIQEHVTSNHPAGVLASASWKVVERLPGATLLEVRLTTGRRNQIRLHCKLMGHPLIGERLYVDPDAPPGPRHHRQALHALRLVVSHPDTGKPLVIEAPEPADFADLLRQLRSPRKRG